MSDLVINNHNIKELELLKNELRIIKNFISCMPKTYRKKNRNWVIVDDILLKGTKHCGCSWARQKCFELGINPDGYVLV